MVIFNAKHEGTHAQIYEYYGCTSHYKIGFPELSTVGNCSGAGLSMEQSIALQQSQDMVDAVGYHAEMIYMMGIVLFVVLFMLLHRGVRL